MRDKNKSTIWKYAAFAKVHILLFATGAGAILVALQAAFEALTRWTHPDAIAQILGVQFWMSGIAGEFYLGATSYIIKFPVYALSSEIISSPYALYVFLCILFSVVTYLGYCYILVKFYRLIFDRKPDSSSKKILASLMLLLASIWPSVFLLHYPNSRNLEILIGLVWFYTLMHIYKQRALSPKPYFFFILLTTALSFADPYQLYVLVAPCLGLIFIKIAANLRKKSAIYKYIVIAAAILIGAAFGKCMQKIIEVITPVRFLLNVDNEIPSGFQALIDSARLTLESILKINGINFYDASIASLLGLGRILAFVGVLLIAVMILKKFSLSATKPRMIQFMILGILASSVSLMAISRLGLGQAYSERYLIVMPFFFAFMVTIYSKSFLKYSSYILLWSSLIFSLSALNVSHDLYAGKSNYFSANKQILGIEKFAKDQGINKIYTEWAEAAPLTFFSNRSVIDIPLRCDESTESFVKYYLLYEKAAATKTKADKTFLALNSKDKKSCFSTEALNRQFGPPVSQHKINNAYGYYNVYIYNYDIIQKLK